jgi:TDG/mug DNA glycosylase family protein
VRCLTPVLPDLLAPGLRIVFCGSAAGAVSARKEAYFAGPGNKFWPTLHATGLTPQLIEPARFRDVLDLGIGLTDLAKFVSGSDASLPRDADDAKGLQTRILRYAPAALAFVGKRPAQVFFREIFDRRKIDYGLQPETLGATALHVLPSPSGLAVRYWDSAPWHALAQQCRLNKD